MPMRGSSQWQHARVQKRVINHDRGGTYVICANLDCENDGYEMHKVVVVDNAPGSEAKTITYVFCSEKCRQYWILAAKRPGSGNNLPPGYKLGIM